MLDQNTGGAIRAAGRCDRYMGIGEGAEQTAAQQLNTGRLYYLAVKPELVAQYSRYATSPPCHAPANRPSHLSMVLMKPISPNSRCRLFSPPFSPMSPLFSLDMRPAAVTASALAAPLGAG